MNLRNRCIVASAVILTCTLGANAEGYQVNTLSARQLGMGHTGVAMKLGSESQFFNPAGMAFMQGQLDASASINAIFPTATATVEGKKYTTDNDPSTPFSALAAFRVSDKVKAGLGFYVPYGSSINWTDNWPGATLNQSVKLQAFTFQPTVAWKILPNLSVGGGFTMTWGNVNLHKGLISGAQLDAMLSAYGIPASFKEITPASVALTGKANVAVGFNLGAMYDFSDHFTAGISYRSKSMLKVKSGESDVLYSVSDPTILGMLSQKLDGISKAQFKAEMPCPAVLTFGGAWHNDRVVADVEAQMTFWKAYKALDIEFIGADQFNQHLAKNYHNAWMFKGGVEWKTLPNLDLRAGLVVDLTPVDKHHYNPETPGMTKVEPSVGLTFRPMPQLGINVGLLYVAGLGEDNVSYTTKNVLTGQDETFTANYKLHAFTASVGFSYSF